MLVNAHALSLKRERGSLHYIEVCFEAETLAFTLLAK